MTVPNRRWGLGTRGLVQRGVSKQSPVQAAKLLTKVSVRTKQEALQRQSQQLPNAWITLLGRTNSGGLWLEVVGRFDEEVGRSRKGDCVVGSCDCGLHHVMSINCRRRCWLVYCGGWRPQHARRG